MGFTAYGYSTGNRKSRLQCTSFGRSRPNGFIRFAEPGKHDQQEAFDPFPNAGSGALPVAHHVEQCSFVQGIGGNCHVA
jgi:hypothetical protein